MSDERGPGGSLLERIIGNKRTEIDALLRRARTRTARAPLDVVAALRRDAGALRLIAEVKLRSPSAGPLSRVLRPEARAVAYARAGAAMVSVLCDSVFFDGTWDHLSASRTATDAAGCPLPLLAKEFILHERQVCEARDRGADAVLVIARIVDTKSLVSLVRAAREEGIEPFVEVTDERELAVAIQAGARVIGVNARDLDTLAIDADRTARVLEAIPPNAIAVHLSGLKAPEDVRRVARSRADAALMGEALMREDDPGPRLRAMVEAAAGSSGV